MIIKGGRHLGSGTSDTKSAPPPDRGRLKFDWSVSDLVKNNVDEPSLFYYMGLTHGERQAIRQANPICGICGLFTPYKYRVTEHCHTCGIVHGVACQWCNLSKPFLYLYGEKIYDNRDALIKRIWGEGKYRNLKESWGDGPPENWHMTKSAIESWNMLCGCPPEVEVHKVIRKFASRLGYCEGILSGYHCAIAKIEVNIQTPSGQDDIKQLHRYPFIIVNSPTGELLGRYNTFRSLELGIADAIKQVDPNAYEKRMASITSGQYTYKPDIPHGIEAFR